MLYIISSDDRITAIGHFLRRFCLDELPQLVNVVKGEMSLVGPRPPMKYEAMLYEEWHKARLAATPGITGLWQVRKRATIRFEEMVLLDLFYMRNWSLWQDIKILIKTIPVVFFGRVM